MSVMTETTHSSTSHTVRLSGEPVHFVSWGGNQYGHTYVLVHGLGGSWMNWSLLAPELMPEGHVYAIDLPGFGKSEPGSRSASVEANVEVLIAFLEKIYSPVVLVGNSMGGMISLLVAAQRPDLVDSLVLVDPALPLPRVRVDPVTATMLTSVLSLYATASSRIVNRLSLRARARLLMATCGVDVTDLPPWLIEQSISLLEERQDIAGMDKALRVAAQSLLKIMLNPAAYYRAMQQIQAPVLLIHGDQDRLIPVGSARAAAARNPKWTYREMAGIGHCPQLQVPQHTASAILSWLR